MSAGTPTGFRRRKGSRLLRAYVDLPEPEAADVATIAATESARTGEPVSVQSVLRRAIRVGLPVLREPLAEIHPAGTGDQLGLGSADGKEPTR